MAEIESLRGKVINVTQQKLATTLVAFGQLVDKACRVRRPNSQWRLALAREWANVKKTVKSDVLY